MYDYIALRVEAKPCDENVTDLLAAFLAESDFETFEPDDKGLTAYIRKDKYNPEFVESVISDFPMEVDLKVETQEIVGEDWNKEWEQNYFKPIEIENKVRIRSTFHEPSEKVPLEIIIDPKMAFGTGHHATTAGMCSQLLKTDLKGKTVIDMGTGTGILSILAKKLGAGKTVGIDIDEFAVENAIENGGLNNVEVEWIAGDDRKLVDLEPSDIFLANINLNVITEHLSNYLSRLKPGGRIFLSGFLTTDRETILKKAESLGLNLIDESSQDNWEVMVMEKR